MRALRGRRWKHWRQSAASREGPLSTNWSGPSAKGTSPKGPGQGRGKRGRPATNIGSHAGLKQSTKMILCLSTILQLWSKQSTILILGRVQKLYHQSTKMIPLDPFLNPFLRVIPPRRLLRFFQNLRRRRARHGQPKRRKKQRNQSRPSPKNSQRSTPISGPRSRSGTSSAGR